MLAVLPRSAALTGGELELGGVRASELARKYGTPVVVYCEETLRAQARAYRSSAPDDALVVFGSKAFPNLALLELFRNEGLGADVASLGEREIALRAGIPGDRIVVHGNNKTDAELAAAATDGSLVVIDAFDEIDRAAAAGVRRALVRVTPGIDADTHEHIRTAHHGSKFGLPPDDTIEALRLLLAAGIDVEGLHTHIGSQLLTLGAAWMTIEWLSVFARRCQSELAWAPRVIDVGGGLGVAHVEDERPPQVEDFVAQLLAEIERAWSLQSLAVPRLVLEPGRSLVGRAGVTLYTVGSIKHAGDGTTFVAVDGGLSDNPRPALYDARYTALLANRADEPATGRYAIAGKHCESGDVLIRDVALPEPRLGDLLAVPATGAYTLSMASNYNASLRPPAVLVSNGNNRLIRRRETIDDLLGFDVR